MRNLTATLCLTIAVFFGSAGFQVSAQTGYFANKRNENGGIYTGFLANGKPQGQGTFIWQNGDRYVGEFKNGKGNGWGTLTRPQGGMRFVGEFKITDKALLPSQTD